MVFNLICGAILIYRLRFLYALLGNILSPAETASLLVYIIWTNISILLILKILSHAAFWIVRLHVLHIVPHNYPFLDQAVRLRSAVDSHNQASIFFFSFDVSQSADILYFQA